MITPEDARRMGAKGSPANEEERALFEAITCFDYYAVEAWSKPKCRK